MFCLCTFAHILHGTLDYIRCFGICWEITIVWCLFPKRLLFLLKISNHNSTNIDLFKVKFSTECYYEFSHGKSTSKCIHFEHYCISTSSFQGITHHLYFKIALPGLYCTRYFVIFVWFYIFILVHLFINIYPPTVIYSTEDSLTQFKDLSLLYVTCNWCFLFQLKTNIHLFSFYWFTSFQHLIREYKTFLIIYIFQIHVIASFILCFSVDYWFIRENYIW
jgi:hypothetical protein